MSNSSIDPFNPNNLSSPILKKKYKKKKKPRNNTIIMIESHVLELSFIILIMVSISSLVGFFLQGKIFVLLNEGL